MTVPSRSLLTKGIFAVSVVAVVAVVGTIGFAKAAPGDPGTGYGNTGQLIRAAVADFQAAIRAAQQAFLGDVNSCLADLNSNSLAENNFRNRNLAAANVLSATAANPAFNAKTSNQMDSSLGSAQNQVGNQIDSSTDQMVASLDRNVNPDNRVQTFRQCVQTARHTFLDSIRDARQTFIDTIRSILGR